MTNSAPPLPKSWGRGTTTAAAPPPTLSDAGDKKQRVDRRRRLALSLSQVPDHGAGAPPPHHRPPLGAPGTSKRQVHRRRRFAPPPPRSTKRAPAPASSPCSSLLLECGANITPVSSSPSTLCSAPRAAPTQDAGVFFLLRLAPPRRACLHPVIMSSSPLSLVAAGCLLVLLAASAIPACVCVNDDYSMQTIATSLGADRALGWGNDSSPCTDGWTGVVCNERGRVTAIRARNASLNGTLPRDIAMPWLKELDLRDNAITGQLPSTVFLRLERLRLDNNNFTSVAVGFLAAAKLLQVIQFSSRQFVSSIYNSVQLILSCSMCQLNALLERMNC